MRPPQLEAITAFEPLTAIPAVAAEAWIRIGLVHVTVGGHAAALRAFETAQPLAASPELKYVSHFLAGRALEASNRPDEAMTQYRRALEIVPGAESATIVLSSLQFLRNDRDQATTAIDHLFNQPSTSADPGRLIGYGSFMHWPSLKAAMRSSI